MLSLKQLILRFDDINQPMDDYVVPQMSHIKRALDFADKIKDGSIILIHMPERGIREWNLEAMELTLKGLKEKGYDIVTFSKLYELSK